MRRVGALVLLVACALSAAAQEPPRPAYETFPQAVGVFALSIPTEGGLQYQRWLGAAGFQLMGGVFYNPMLGTSGKLFDYWIEAEGLYRIYGERFADWLSGQLYLWARLGHQGYIEQTYDTTVTTSPFVPVLVGGFGVGIEVVLFQHFSAPLEFGYDGQLPFGYSSPLVSLSVAGGLRYRF